ncbi:MAG: xanthine dehydrogenase family protein molybdopterin-binding subunit [Planctomycetaceae bacterium]|nr:xanthine dehydrogenase family protein molybdopterin-binding subunit [Planctomycetaceae bacterium]
MAERKIHWKNSFENKLLGTRVPRVEGVSIATGQAKYTADINHPGTLFARALVSLNAYARIKSVDIEPAKQIPGVKAVKLLKQTGDELLWDGQLIAVVAAERPEFAQDGVRAIKIEYEVLEHFVDAEDLETAQSAGKVNRLRGQEEGEVQRTFLGAEVIHEGYYGLQTVSHACLEPHGAHTEWKGDDQLHVYLSTQNVSGTASQFAVPLGLKTANVTVQCDYLGGGFGSKSSPGEWGLVAAELARETGRPVKFMLDRTTELKTAGIRPSAFCKVRIAADKQGNVTAWEADLWGTTDTEGKTIAATALPYAFDIKNRLTRASGIRINGGPEQPWRAPDAPQACAITQTAMDDLAAKLELDPYQLFLKNLDKTWNPDLYTDQMRIAAELMEWEQNWKPRGTNKQDGAMRRGLGMALHEWTGKAHTASTTIRVHADGTVETFGGSQELGTGTRTVIGITVAETFGIPLDRVKVNIGSSTYPRSERSSRSSTAGGVSGPNRRAALKALWKIFDLVAGHYQVEASRLEAVEGKIRANGQDICTWEEATALIGTMPLEVQGEGPEADGLTGSRVGGVQMADVSVDIETGKVQINRFVAVQDCGLILNRLAAESQVYGGIIMGIASALFEERILDNKTGRFINADLFNYKLPRIGDIGDLKVHLYETEETRKQGVIGLGEPPVISSGAALSNAVANAIGVRVPVLPMTPIRVLNALEGGQS